MQKEEIINNINTSIKEYSNTDSDTSIISGDNEQNILRLLYNTISIGRLPIHSTKRWWNLSLDHQVIALLAVASKLNVLPLEFTMDNKTQNCVPMRIVHNLCTCSHTTIQKIVSDGLYRGELIAVKPNKGDKRHSVFTASNDLVKNFQSLQR